MSFKINSFFGAIGRLAFIFSCFVISTVSYASPNNDSHEKWLKDQFSEQHQALIPIVAVANIFSGCNQIRKFDPINYQIKDLVLKMDKQVLSDKTLGCLANDKIHSEVAIDFGVLACFKQQMSHQTKAEIKEKMAQVSKALAELPLSEKKKSFTECTTYQAIEYLQ